MAASISKALRTSTTIHHHHHFLNPLHKFALQSSLYATSSSINPSINPSTSSSLSSHPNLQGEKERGIWLKMLLFVPGAITFGLGSWQIFRRHDKIKMLDYRKERLESEPINLSAISSIENPSNFEFRRVACRGVIDEKKSIFVGPRSRSISGVTENGYYLITPLLPFSGDQNSVQSPVLVNRGWVPRSWKDKALKSVEDVEETRNVTSPSSSHGKSSFWRFWFKNPEKNEEQAPHVSIVDVIGVVRGSEKPSIFVPENDPVSGQWFYVDVPAIAKATGLPENAFYIEDVGENVNPGNPYPIPKDANSLIRSSVMPQDHLNYTLTWYSLSAAVTFMAYKRLKPRKSPR